MNKFTLSLIFLNSLFVSIGTANCRFAHFEIGRGNRALMQKENGYF